MKFRVLRVHHTVTVLPMLYASVKLLYQPAHVGRYTLQVGAVNGRDTSDQADADGAAVAVRLRYLFPLDQTSWYLVRFPGEHYSMERAASIAAKPFQEQQVVYEL